MRLVFSWQEESPFNCYNWSHLLTLVPMKKCQFTKRSSKHCPLLLYWWFYHVGSSFMLMRLQRHTEIVFVHKIPVRNPMRIYSKPISLVEQPSKYNFRKLFNSLIDFSELSLTLEHLLNLKAFKSLHDLTRQSTPTLPTWPTI